LDRTRRAEVFQLHAQFCQALADPKRLLLLMELRDGPRTVGELAAAITNTQSNTSQHLAVLREKGIVDADREGTFVRYSLADRRILEAIDILLAVLASQFERRAAHGVTLRALRSFARPRRPTGTRAEAVTTRR